MTRDRVVDIIGSAVPSAVFVAVTSWAGIVAGLIAGCVAAAGLTVLAAARRRPVGQALSGFIGIGVTAAIARLTGSDAAIFLPDIWWSLGACLTLLLSVLVGYPLVGVAWSLTQRAPMWWRRDPPAARALTWASLAAAGVFGGRFVVQRWLYDADEIRWLAAARIAMGLPLTLAALAVVVWAVRRTEQRGRHCAAGTG